MIRVGELIDGGTSCYPIPGSPCAGVFTLDVLQMGGVIRANLQDGLVVSDASGHVQSASLTDGLNIDDRNFPPLVATLSDVVGVIDHYIAPAVAPLSDVVGVVDHYVSPVSAVLTDTVNLAEHFTSNPSAPVIVGLTGSAGALLFVGLLVVRKRRQRKSS